MFAVEVIGDEEIILRRIPPPRIGMDSTKPRPNGGLRATSLRLSVKDGETGLSCTRLQQTSPQALLNDLASDKIDPADWLVCRIFLRDVRKLDLEVIHKPTDRDPGHCEILGTKGVLSFPNNKSQQLAKATRILTNEEVATMQAGCLLAD